MTIPGSNRTGLTLTFLLPVNESGSGQSISTVVRGEGAASDSRGRRGLSR
jgi:hypothetical protein